MKNLLSLALASLVLGVFCIFAANAAATDAGAAELNLLNMLFRGPIGFALGLGVVVMGIIEFFVNGDKRGITLIILGVLVTLTPGIYNSASHLFIPMVCNLWSLQCK